jgi:pilus assembly protein CpaE
MSFEEVEGLKDKIKIIVNRFGLDAGQIGIKKAQETIGREIFWQLPNDYRVMVEVRNNGVPLIEHAPRSGIAQSFVGLADALQGKPADDGAEEDGKTTRRWLNFWPAKGGAKPAEKE